MSDFVDWALSSEPASREVTKHKQKPASEMKRKSGPKLRESCDECSNAKVRCSKDKPVCRRCNAKGRTCTYGLSARSGRRQMRNRAATTSTSSQCLGSSTINTSTAAGHVTQSDPFSGVPWDELTTSFNPAAHDEKAYSQGQALSGSILSSPAFTKGGTPASDMPFDFSLTSFQSTSSEGTISPEARASPATASISHVHEAAMPPADDLWLSTLQTGNTFESQANDDIFDDVCFSPKTTTKSSPSAFDDESYESQSPPTSEDSCDPLSTIFEVPMAQSDVCSPNNACPRPLESIQRASDGCDCMAQVLGILNEYRRRIPSKVVTGQSSGSQDGINSNQILLDACNSALECGCLEEDQRTTSLLMCTFMDIMTRASRNEGSERVEFRSLLAFIRSFSQSLKRTEGCYTQWRDSPFVNFWKITDYSC